MDMASNLFTFTFTFTCDHDSATMNGGLHPLEVENRSWLQGVSVSLWMRPRNQSRSGTHTTPMEGEQLYATCMPTMHVHRAAVLPLLS